MSTLETLSNELAAAVAGAAASVLRIDARRGPTASATVWSADGVLVTADHVVEKEEGIEVGLPDGSTTTADLVGRDPTTDLAVLRAKATDQLVPAWGDAPKVGGLLLGLWRPGRSTRATLGIVSAAGGEWRTPGNGRIDAYVEADIGRRPGLSGGLLLDAAGHGVALATTGLIRRTVMGIPKVTLDRVVAQILAHGGVRRGWLGIGVQPVRVPEIGGEAARIGLIVVAVQAGSPAATGGLFLGDVIVAFAGSPLAGQGDLQARLDGDSVGKEVPVRVLRAGGFVDLKVTIGAKG
jgi:S1-C subfamily serine protease